MKTRSSRALMRRAMRLIPGGVNSPVRAFGAVGGTPPFIQIGHGAQVTDEDGNVFLDYVGSWGPLILGHAHPEVVRAVQRAAARGTSFGAPTRAEVDLAHEIRAAVPSMERVRLVNSGTEACMSALRAARGFTGRDLIVKFEGCYHGHADALLVKAGSGAATFGVPSSAGVPRRTVATTVVLPYNRIEPLRRLLRARGRRIAAVIVEPVAGNMGVVPPSVEWLGDMRALTAHHGVLLVFDEVMSGFRACYGGAQRVFGIRPDLTCLGKVIGGGLPLAAYGGRRDVMDRIAPVGPVYQAGTLSGNPLAVAAGLAQLRSLRKDRSIYPRLERMTRALGEGLAPLGTVQRFGSMLTLFFTRKPVTGWKDAATCDVKAFARFFRGMLERGIYLPPSQFEAWFVSAAHTDRDIRATIEAAHEAV